MLNLVTLLTSLLARCLNNISCAVNSIIEPSLEETAPETVRLLPPKEEKLEDYIIVSELVNAHIAEYKSNNGSEPTHVFLHPKLVKILANEMHTRAMQPFSFRHIYRNLSWQMPMSMAKIEMVEVSEREDFVLVGDESAYNDYLMERDILGDHH